jgi:hypothetical protein
MSPANQQHRPDIYKIQQNVCFACAVSSNALSSQAPSAYSAIMGPPRVLCGRVVRLVSTGVSAFPPDYKVVSAHALLGSVETGP